MPSPSDRFLKAAKSNGYKPYYPQPAKTGAHPWAQPGDNYNKTIKVDLKRVKEHKLHEYYALKHQKMAFYTKEGLEGEFDSKPEGEPTYSAFGSLISAVLTPEQEAKVLKNDIAPQFCHEMIHLRWTLDAIEVGRIEMIADPVKARQEAFKLAVKRKLIEFKADEMDLADELGFTEDKVLEDI